MLHLKEFSVVLLLFQLVSKLYQRSKECADPLPQYHEAIKKKSIYQYFHPPGSVKNTTAFLKVYV